MNDDTSTNQEQQEPTEGQIKFQESIQEHSGQSIDDKTQEELNTPFSDSNTSLTQEDNAFLDDIMNKVEQGEINLYAPSSILNEAVYNELSGENKAKADLFLNSTLFVIRQIHDFYKSEHSNDSDMMINMVQELRLKKETLEKELGDVLKI